MYSKNLHRKLGFIILIFNILMMIGSTYHFLFVFKFPILAWLLFNACVPACTLYILGYFLKKPVLLNTSIPFMLMFGGGGLFLFHWYGPALIAQLGHIFMVLAILWIFFENQMQMQWKKAFIGFGIGFVGFFLFTTAQKYYSLEHMELFNAFKELVDVEKIMSLYSH